jgi:hypothetical protein
MPLISHGSEAKSNLTRLGHHNTIKSDHKKDPLWDTLTDATYNEYDFILLTGFFTFSVNRSLGRICQQLETFPRDCCQGCQMWNLS